MPPGGESVNCLGDLFSPDLPTSGSVVCKSFEGLSLWLTILGKVSEILYGSWRQVFSVKVGVYPFEREIWGERDREQAREQQC